jgi:hypothetical protein
MISSRLIVVHSGQTGVERGVHRAAVALGLSIAGFSSLEQRDEFGKLPDSIASALSPCVRRGVRSPIMANLEIASGLIIVVPDAHLAARTPGVSAILTHARRCSVPYRIVDGRSDFDDIAAWAEQLSTADEVRLMVTGPRETRWPQGEGAGWRLLTTMVM